MLNKKDIVLENIYGMKNFYKPGWHFDIDSNLMVEYGKPYVKGEVVEEDEVEALERQ